MTLYTKEIIVKYKSANRFAEDAVITCPFFSEKLLHLQSAINVAFAELLREIEPVEDSVAPINCLARREVRL